MHGAAFNRSRLHLGRVGALAVFLLCGCSIASHPAETQRTFDFGPPPSGVANDSPRGTLVIPAAQTASRLDSTSVTYRLGYARLNEPMSYANSQWAMSPGELLTQRIRGALASRVGVIPEANSAADPVLHVELDEFSQVFDAPDQSRGLVQFRATLSRDGKLLGQKSFVFQSPAPTADARGGVKALTASSDEAIASLSSWVGALLP